MLFPEQLKFHYVMAITVYLIFFFLHIESPLLRADLVEEGSYLFGFRETIAWK